MAEPLKNHFGPDVPVGIADMIEPVFPELERDAFLRDALDGYEALELTQRARHVAGALATHLPPDRDLAIRVVIDALGPEIEGSELTGMASFLYLPFVFFVAEHGLDHFETAMRAQYELTKRFTAEFSIRAYLEAHPEPTLDRLREWTRDPNVHVRRLVSEGTRPRLPWAPRLRAFQVDPGPVLELLELLKDDPEEYVRRSVANNLNDISKDHPEIAVAVAERWWENGSADRRRLVRHGLRTMVKRGDESALAVLGFAADSPVVVRSVSCEPAQVEIGQKVKIVAEFENPGGQVAPTLADLRVHFRKASGSTSPKVFKGIVADIEPGALLTVRKTISLAQHTTRKHYPGPHRVEIMINGRTHEGASFHVV